MPEKTEVYLGSDKQPGLAMWYSGINDDDIADFVGTHMVERGLSPAVHSENWKPTNEAENKYFAELWVNGVWFPVFTGDLIVQTGDQFEVYTCQQLHEHDVEVISSHSKTFLEPNVVWMKINKEQIALAKQHGFDEHEQEVKEKLRTALLVDGQDFPEDEPPLNLPGDSDYVQQVLQGAVTVPSTEEIPEEKITLNPPKPPELVSYVYDFDDLQTIVAGGIESGTPELIGMHKDVSLKEFSGVCDSLGYFSASNMGRHEHTTLAEYAIRIFRQLGRRVTVQVVYDWLAENYNLRSIAENLVSGEADW